ncbi:MAG TPA: hypoxanthine phosphoribosyltransferase [Opitutales bacterium]|nr:hypoxanthine phosphoribosyltransferase [Opitutales bacterium]
MEEKLEKVLITEEELGERVKELGREITDFYQGNELTIVSIINGAIFFTADLLREIVLPVRLDCARISSYQNETVSEGEPEILFNIEIEIEGRHVLVIDDILDSGKTLLKITSLLKKLDVKSLRTCVLLDKKERREVSFEADFVGFSIPDEFVVGYGLDFAELYRNLRCIGVLKPEFQNPPEWS